MAFIDQRVVITGGATGLGRAMADAFLAEGARVAICDIDVQALQRSTAKYRHAIAVQADVADENAMRAFFGTIETQWGGVDIVCANAGTGGPAGPIESLGYDEWRGCLASNLDGSFLTCRWAAGQMRARGSGLIVITSSTAGLMGYPLRAPYAAAKWGLIGLTKSLAMELGPSGVRVNAICPGAVEGPRMDRVVANEAAARNISESEVKERYVRGVSLKTWISPEEVAASVMYLASPAGAKISGQVLAIDGHTETLAP